jgi:hypothetical protein
MANEFVAKNGLISQNDSIVTGSLTVTAGITGSSFGTSSWANNAQTASFVTLSQTASFVTTAQTASYVLNAVSASYATTSSYVNTFVIAVNFETITSYTYKAPYSIAVNSLESNPSGSVTLSYVPSGSVSASNYVFGATINKFDSLTIVPLTSSLVILNSVRI